LRMEVDGPVDGSCSVRVLLDSMGDQIGIFHREGSGTPGTA
jgi:hypothetical protein